MPKRVWIPLSVIALTVIVFFITSLNHDPGVIRVAKRTLGYDASPLPDFSQYTDVKAKKQAFFSYLQPIVEINNQQILADRQRMESLTDTLAADLSASNQDFVADLIYRYRVKDTLSGAALHQELMRRLDTVPVSLALSQAAMESAWGTSRFAREGNNLFGQWCYEAGCGIVPKRRGAGQVHEVASFDDVDAAVASYLRNINSHPAYSDLRGARAQLRASGETVTGTILAAHLLRYSERGQDYVDEIRSMIRVNKLGALDLAEAS